MAGRWPVGLPCRLAKAGIPRFSSLTRGPGLDDHQRFRADQLAKLGYVAFALDY